LTSKFSPVGSRFEQQRFEQGAFAQSVFFVQALGTKLQ